MYSIFKKVSAVLFPNLVENLQPWTSSPSRLNSSETILSVKNFHFKFHLKDVIFWNLNAFEGLEIFCPLFDLSCVFWDSCDVSSLNVRVVTPDDGTEAWNEARNQFAVKHFASTEFTEEHLNPGIIVFVANDDDVLEAIDFANRCDYTITVRAGGHQYAGYSSCGSSCMQLDVTGIFVIEI